MYFGRWMNKSKLFLALLAASMHYAFIIVTDDVFQFMTRELR